MGRSPMRMVPSLIDSKPAIMRSVEVFPQPDDPTSPMISPSLMRMLTSLTASVAGRPFCS